MNTFIAATSGEGSVLAAQIALPQAVVASLYTAHARYAGSAENLSRLAVGSDNVFGDNTDAQLEQQAPVMSCHSSAGYIGIVTIPVGFNADRTVSVPPSPGRGAG